MMRRLACLFLLGFVVASPLSSARAQGTRLWTTSSFQQLEQGTPHGVAIASDGRLLPGPASKLVYTTPSTYVWSVAADKQGNAYLATGSPATVIKVTPAGKATTLFKSKDLNVQAVTVGPHGSVYAATLPSGKIYKLNPDTTNATSATAQVVFDPAKTKEKSKYVWALKFGPKGGLYIATGEPAAIYRVAPGGKPALFYKSDEVHIHTLAFAPNGDLIAGSVGSGLVYRINKAGQAFVLFDAPKKETPSAAVPPDGTIYPAGVGAKGQTPPPPLPAGPAPRLSPGAPRDRRPRDRDPGATPRTGPAGPAGSGPGDGSGVRARIGQTPDRRIGPGPPRPPATAPPIAPGARTPRRPARQRPAPGAVGPARAGAAPPSRR